MNLQARRGAGCSLGICESLPISQDTALLAELGQALTQLPPLTGSLQKSIKRLLNGLGSAEGTCGDGGGNVTAVTAVVSERRWSGPGTVT